MFKSKNGVSTSVNARHVYFAGSLFGSLFQSLIAVYTFQKKLMQSSVQVGIEPREGRVSRSIHYAYTWLRSVQICDRTVHASFTLGKRDAV